MKAKVSEKSPPTSGKRVAEGASFMCAKRARGGSVVQRNCEHSHSKSDEIAKLSQGCRRHLQAAVDEALAKLSAVKRKAADADADQKMKASLQKKALDRISELKRQLKASDERLATASGQQSKANIEYLNKKDALDTAKSDLEKAENLYKQHFLPLKGAGEEKSKEPWAVSSKRHVDALLPKLMEMQAEDCLLEAFKKAASQTPEERKGFCDKCVEEVDKLLQKSLALKKGAVDAAISPSKAAEQALKDATDAQDKVRKDNSDIVAKLVTAEDNERKAKAALDGANNNLEKVRQDMKDFTQVHADKLADFDNFTNKEKELLEAEARVDDAVKTVRQAEEAERSALERQFRTGKDVDRASEALEEARRKCGEARLEAEKARAAAAEAKGNFDDAVAELARCEDLIKKHFVPLRAGRFENIQDVHAHMSALKPIFDNLEIEPCLRAGFDAATCHTKDERGAFCTKVVAEVEKCLDKYIAKLKEKIAALRGPLEKLEAEAKRLGQLQDRACGSAVRDAEAFLEKMRAADNDAMKAVEKAQAALDGLDADLAARVQFRDQKLEEAKIACGNHCGNH